MIDPETARPDEAFTPDQLEAMQASGDPYFVFLGLVGGELSRLSMSRDGEALLAAARTEGIVRYAQDQSGNSLEVRLVSSTHGHEAGQHPRRAELPSPYSRFDYFFGGTVCVRQIPGYSHSLYEFWEINGDPGLDGNIVITAEEFDAGEKLEEIAPSEQAEMMAALEAQVRLAESGGDREAAEMHRAALGDLALTGCRWVPGYVPVGQLRVIAAGEASYLGAIMEDALSSGGPILP